MTGYADPARPQGKALPLFSLGRCHELYPAVQMIEKLRRNDRLTAVGDVHVLDRATDAEVGDRGIRQLLTSQRR
jgi:hypothetical protein